MHTKLLSAIHIGLQNYRCRNLIDQSLIAASHLADTAINHRPMRQNRGKSLIIEGHLNLRECSAQSRCQRLDKSPRLARLTIHLRRLAQHDGRHIVRRHILRQPLLQLLGIKRSESPCNDLQRVTDSYTCAASAVIYGKYSTQ